MLNEPGAARRIESREEDRLSEFDRNIVGEAVRLTFPLRDPVECYRHMKMTIETCEAILARLQHRSKDRSQLFMVRGMLRELHQKMNAYRNGRRD